MVEMHDLKIRESAATGDLEEVVDERVAKEQEIYELTRLNAELRRSRAHKILEIKVLKKKNRGYRRKIAELKGHE